jgi:hypothetical protein
VQKRVLRYFSRHGLLDEETTLAMLDWQGSGGFSIDASVRIEGHDRFGIERLVRYCARPPFALGRLHAPDGIPSLADPDALLIYQVPSRQDRTERAEIAEAAAAADGPAPSILLLTPLELLRRIARLVPPPRLHRHRYHGVLAPNARLRARVVAIGRPETIDAAGEATGEAAGEPDTVDPGVGPPGAPDVEGGFVARGSGELQELQEQPSERSSRARRIRWAQLLARVFEVLPLLCPACGGSIRIISFLTDPPVVRAILLHLDLPHSPPLFAPARGPPLDPQGDFLFDQSLGASPSSDPISPESVEPVPEYIFDQSASEDWDLAPEPPGPESDTEHGGAADPDWD